MTNKYRIIERQGVFIVFFLYKRFELFKLKTIETWEVAYKAIGTPAHFYSLEEARNWIRIITKPDIEHDI